MRSLRTLSLSKISSDQLQSEEFLEFGNELEDLKVSQGGLKGVQGNAFKYVRGLKRIDLSENRISKIDDDAFKDLEHSLIALKMAHALSPDYHTVSPNIFKPLGSLQFLDMSNNRLKAISETSFHFMKAIRALEFRDNQIDQIAKGTFQGDIHARLETVSFAYNTIKYIGQHTFVDLGSLQHLNLDDNRIEKIERRGFMNLDQLKTLSLRGNKISSISDESFQVSVKRGKERETLVLNGNIAVLLKSLSTLASTFSGSCSSRAYSCPALSGCPCCQHRGRHDHHLLHRPAS